MRGVFVLVMTLLVAGLPGIAVAREAPVGARSGLLVDDATGRTLWARHADERRPVASITKVMTALVVLRAGHLDRTIRIAAAHRAYAAARHGSTAGLRVGDRLTARDLLAALLLPSGCDAAAALADAYGPGRTRFVRRMNATARALGLRNTRYTDAAGLPEPSGADASHSTARDQVLLGRRALRVPGFALIVRRARYVVPRTAAHGRYVWRTTNALLTTYRGATGVKTGYTRAAGYSLLFAARRRGRTLVGIVLNSARTDARFADARRLLDRGFTGRFT
ncbi:D-alanyl-D-alanine carboxypeptidase family protein [Actinomadura rayongensis]|uniref:D-alanyl-D-alanine carboxypeptidase n=1 Tax=Actinomadura rayongensis TaxID=1429076 RepID=A0A6I4WBS2_9ACTN|nr:serine hydrolase [Actinomadura rayongensis]MXQ65486.1 D-alanyl-D-alanine carboxypeptidase [Actinomadura rayongensis]